jgi:hypothetical protein
MGYEKIVGTIHFAVDPRNPRNTVTVDLDKAPTTVAQGLVSRRTCSSCARGTRRGPTVSR